MSRKTKDVLQNIILYALLLAMVLLALSYFLEIRAMQTGKETVSLEKMWLLTDGDDRVRTVSVSDGLVLPSFMGCKREDGEMIGVSGDPKFIASLYGRFSDYLSAWFGNGYSCSRLDDKTGKDGWEAALSSDCFLFVRYYDALPFPLIYQFLSEKTLSDPAAISLGDVVSVKDLLVGIDERGVTRVLTRGNGYYASFSPLLPENAVHLSPSLLSSFSGSAGLYAFRFSTSAEYPDLEEGTVLSESVPSFPLLKIGATSDASFPDDGASFDSLLALFDADPSFVNRYSEQDGKTVWIAPDFRIEWTEGGYFSFTTSEAGNGLSFEKIFGYSAASGKYSLYESVRLLSSFAISLSDIFIPSLSPGDLQICGLYTDGDGNTVLSLDLCCSGLPIVRAGNEGRPSALSFVFRDGALLSVRFSAVGFSVDAGQGRPSFSSAWIARHSSVTGGPFSLSLVYRLTDDGSPASVPASWFYEKSLAPGGEKD